MRVVYIPRDADGEALETFLVDAMRRWPCVPWASFRHEEWARIGRVHAVLGERLRK